MLWPQRSNDRGAHSEGVPLRWAASGVRGFSRFTNEGRDMLPIFVQKFIEFFSFCQKNDEHQIRFAMFF